MLDFYTVTEQYPDLKANENFLRLQSDLAALEEKINQSRRYYNGTVREYNQSRAVFPKNVVAGMFGFQDEVFFLEDPNAKTAPKISFS
jgi:LemA protein